MKLSKKFNYRNFDGIYGNKYEICQILYRIIQGIS